MPLTTRSLCLIWLVFFAGFAAFKIANCFAEDSPAAQRLKAEVQRQQAETKRKIEQQSKEIKAAHDRNSQKTLANVAKSRSDASTKSATPAFDAANAPPPAECLKAFIAAAKSASSMEQVLPYLTEAKQKGLRSRQASYDPKQAAKNREWHRQQNPNMSEESLTHLSSPPFDFALKFHKSVANGIIDILSVKIDGDKALLGVSTNNGATINGEHYGYGAADVEMIGEGRTWKLSGYKTDIMVFKDVPR